MNRRTDFEHRFVDAAPEVLDDGVLYVSIRYATALHRCACGCGSEIVTPISRTGWILTFDGTAVTLHPSIGNWNYPCRSHYWIRHDRIEWARDRFAGRGSDRATTAVATQEPGNPANAGGLLKRIRRLTAGWWARRRRHASRGT
jgi:hypothetical protein